MNAQDLGTKTAVVVDNALSSVVTGSSSAKHAVSTFWGAFRGELAARKAARAQAEHAEAHYAAQSAEQPLPTIIIAR